MGGAYEDTIETKPIKGTGVTEGEVSGIRYHLVGGTVHFHDDKAKPPQKVEVPLSDWLKRWEILRHPTEWVLEGKVQSLIARCTYTSTDRKTVLLGQSTLKLIKGQGTTELSLQIIPVTYDKAWVALEDFRNKGK